MDGNKEVRHGWKFLTPWGTTEQYYTEYPLPAPGKKWGAWLEHPQPAATDGNDCGAGRWHVMKRLSAEYAPRNWWPWFAEARGIVGEGAEKFGATAIRLRRVRPAVFARMIRLGWCKGANLYRAYLRDANLTGANLESANLEGAYLRDANLTGANLESAYLRDANLTGANLESAYLRDADLTDAYLRDANLTGANLTGADLYRADLYRANLRGANLRDADLTDADLTGADLRGADLPKGFIAKDATDDTA
jgi:hypothetical protein